MVSIRKSRERACQRPTWRLLSATPVAALLIRGRGCRRRLGPGAEVFGAGVPWKEALQYRAGQRLPAVAAAFVEVGGQVGEQVQAGHPGGREDGPDHRRV